MQLRPILTITLKMILCTGLLLPVSLSSWGLAGWMTLETAAAANQQVDPAPKELRRFAEDVIRKLAQSKSFTTWDGADTFIEPLGPGTHSWLVTVQPAQTKEEAEGTPLGYLIISVTADGQYKLVEYGAGPDSLYAKATLSVGLKDSGIASEMNSIEVTAIPLYGGPALAEWLIKEPGNGSAVQFLNASTGEQLPETVKSWELQTVSYKAPQTAAGSSQPELTPSRILRTAESFKPYDNLLWMTAKELPNKPEALIKQLTLSKQLVFVASGPKRTYSLPLPVYGYQTWTEDDSPNVDKKLTGSIYLLTGSAASPRLIALDALMDAGKFVKYQDQHSFTLTKAQ
ncbi:hypothetical protein ACFQ3W_10290 [Paenibacillus puldeungensis]|uniref:Uncharacterized protein n=1 Tax=Paenibacillus puldeungensis TaxID=696536 RepID=A0ABW3RWM5_9BACL